jgi:hypothetical protein
VLVGDTARMPLAAFVPVQLPEAVHEVALVEDQVTIEILPGVMLVGLAEIATVGGSIHVRPKNVRQGPKSDRAGTASAASTKGESTINKASALASRALAL